MNLPAPSLSSSFRQFSGWWNVLHGSVAFMLVGLLEQVASTRLSQWKHRCLFSGTIRTFDASPAETTHCEAAVLLRQAVASVDDNCPKQPLTVAPLLILAKHCPSLDNEQCSAWRTLGLWAQFASKVELQTIQFSSLRTVSKLQLSREEHELQSGFDELKQAI